MATSKVTATLTTTNPPSGVNISEHAGCLSNAIDALNNAIGDLEDGLNHFLRPHDVPAEGLATISNAHSPHASYLESLTLRVDGMTDCVQSLINRLDA